VQAPKRREQSRGATPAVDRARLYRYALGAAGLVAVIAVALVLALVVGKGSSAPGTQQVAAVMRAAGCTFQTVPSHRYPKNGGPLHISSLADKVTYNSYPPSSGWHFPSPALWGDYSQPVNPKIAVHNQEHGGIVVWYGPKISEADRQKIDQFYQQSPNAILVTPLVETFPGITYPKHKPLGSRIALTAWVAPSGVGKGVVSICPSVNINAFDKFRDTFRGHGPEHFPVGILTPGS
jgi:Protein of unknown function (DUF3105)